MKRLIRSSIAVAALAVPLAGPPTPALAADDVVVGAVLPLTGSLAPSGARLRNAMQLAQDLVNGGANLHYPLPMTGTHGFPNLGGAKLRIVFGDSQGKPDQAKTVVDDLVTREHAVAILGSYQSAVTLTASQEAERLGIPFVNPDSSSPALIKRNLTWFFRITPDDDTFAANLFDFMNDLRKTRKLSFNKLAIVHEDTLFGKGSADAENALAKRDNYNVVADVPYPSGTSEVESEVQRVKAAAPDVLLMASYLNDAILFMKTFKQQNVAPQAILAQDAGFVEPAFSKTLGKDADGIFSREVWSLNLKLKNHGAPLVNELYKSRYGTNMDGNNGRDFMAVLVLADAVNRARSTKPDAIRTALRATNIPGEQTIMPWQAIRFDARGQNTGARGIVVQLQAGEYQTVWPAEFATRKPVWPLPAWSAR